MSLMLSLCDCHVIPTRVGITDVRKSKDPTRTYFLRARMRAEGDRRWRTFAAVMRDAVAKEDVVGLRGIGKLPHADKTAGFAAFVRNEINGKVFGHDGTWTRRYVDEAAKIAEKRARELLGVRDAFDPDEPRNEKGEWTSSARFFKGEGGLGAKYTGKQWGEGTVYASSNLETASIYGMYGGVSAIRVHPDATIVTAESEAAKAISNSSDSKKEAERRGVDVIHNTKSEWVNGVSPHEVIIFNKSNVKQERLSRKEKTESQKTRSIIRQVNLEKLKRAGIEPPPITDAADPSRIASMQSLAASELRGVCEAAQVKIVRVVTHAVMAGDNPYKVANEVSKVVREMRNRTRAMAEYVVAKTSAVVTLSCFRGAGISHVGVVPERVSKRAKVGDAEMEDARRRQGPGSLLKGRAPSASTIGRIFAAQARVEEEVGTEEVEVLTAEDDDVCAECQDIADGGPYDLATAEGLIPAHNYCRCAFAPAVMYGDAATEAAGVLFRTKAGEMLFLKRSDTGEWSIPAGGLEERETPLHAAQRESAEEVGYPGDVRAEKVDERTTRGVRFHTFLQPAEWQFEPILNAEHTEFGWFSPPNLPEPLHPGLVATLHTMSEGGGAVPVGDFDPDEPRDPGGRWTASGGGYIYHGTSSKHLSSIQAQGLIDPMNLEKQSVMFHSNQEMSEVYAKTSANPRIYGGGPILLRVHSENVHINRSYNMENEAGHVLNVKGPISPKHIEIRRNGVWEKLKENDSHRTNDFNPDQPRDPKGRWGAGGVTGVANAVHKLREFATSKEARAVIHKVAETINENKRELLAGAVTFALYHVAGADFPVEVESAVHEQVVHFAENAQVAVGEARDLMKKSVDAMIALRSKLSIDTVDNDEVMATLLKLRDILERMKV